METPTKDLMVTSRSSRSATTDEYVRIAREYQLPAAAKLKLDADMQQAQAISIVITLLAGSLIALTAILGGIDSKDEGSKSWKAFRVLMWSAIVFDIGEAFVCIFAIKMCSELPLLAMEHEMRLLEKEGSTEGLLEVVAQRDKLGPRIMNDRYLILESVGMPRSYRIVDRLVLGLLVTASIFSFVTLFFWVAQTQTLITAGVTIVSFVIVVILVITVFAISIGVGHRIR